MPKTAPKSLSQREADYAEARKRILGEEQQQQQVAVAAQIQGITVLNAELAAMFVVAIKSLKG